MKTSITYKTQLVATPQLDGVLNTHTSEGWIYQDIKPGDVYGTQWLVIFSRHTHVPEYAHEVKLDKQAFDLEVNPENVPRSALPPGYRFLRASELDSNRVIKNQKLWVKLWSEGFNGVPLQGWENTPLISAWTFAVSEAEEPVSVPDMGSQVHHTAPTTTPMDEDRPAIGNPAPEVRPYGP